MLIVSENAVHLLQQRLVLSEAETFELKQQLNYTTQLLNETEAEYELLETNYEELYDEKVEIMAELASTPKNVADLVDAYEQDPDNIDNLRLLTENLILELEIAQNNSLAHSLEFAMEKEQFIDLIDELTSNNTELEDKLQLTIDYWTFALETAEDEHSSNVTAMQEDHAAEIEQINSQNDDLT
jgi:hypothetical protein